MVSAKFMFFMPMVMGVAAAKKLVLKLLLFFFPFLAHLFKLCPFYDTHSTKLHHHKHHISHHHHVSPHKHHPEVILDHPPSHKHHPEIILDHPPSHLYDHDHPPHLHDDDHHSHYTGLEYFADGPGFTHEYVLFIFYSWIMSMLLPYLVRRAQYYNLCVIRGICNVIRVLQLFSK